MDKVHFVLCSIEELSLSNAKSEKSGSIRIMESQIVDSELSYNGGEIEVEKSYLKKVKFELGIQQKICFKDCVVEGVAITNKKGCNKIYVTFVNCIFVTPVSLAEMRGNILVQGMSIKKCDGSVFRNYKKDYVIIENEKLVIK